MRVRDRLGLGTDPVVRRWRRLARRGPFPYFLPREVTQRGPRTLRLRLAALHGLAALSVSDGVKTIVLWTLLGGALVSALYLLGSTLPLLFLALAVPLFFAVRLLRVLLSVESVLSVRSRLELLVLAAVVAAPIGLFFGLAALAEPRECTRAYLTALCLGVSLEGLRTHLLRFRFGSRSAELVNTIKGVGPRGAVSSPTQTHYVGPVRTQLDRGRLLLPVWPRLVGLWLAARLRPGRGDYEKRLAKLRCLNDYWHDRLGRVVERAREENARLADHRSDVLLSIEAQALFRMGRGRESLRVLESSRRANENKYLLLSRAYLHWSLGDDAWARKLNDSVLKIDPDCPYALRDRAWEMLEAAAARRRREAKAPPELLDDAESLLASSVRRAMERMGRVPATCLFAYGVLEMLREERAEALRTFREGAWLEQHPGCRLGLAMLSMCGTTTYRLARYQLWKILHSSNLNYDDRILRTAALMLRWIDWAQPRGLVFRDDVVFWLVGPELELEQTIEPPSGLTLPAPRPARAPADHVPVAMPALALGVSKDARAAWRSLRGALEVLRRPAPEPVPAHGDVFERTRRLSRYRPSAPKLCRQALWIAFATRSAKRRILLELEAERGPEGLKRIEAWRQERAQHFPVSVARDAPHPASDAEGL